MLVCTYNASFPVNSVIVHFKLLIYLDFSGILWELGSSVFFQRYSYLFLPVAHGHFRHKNILNSCFQVFQITWTQETRSTNPREDQFIVINFQKIGSCWSFYILWLLTLGRTLLSAYWLWPVLGLFHVPFSYQLWSSMTLGFGETHRKEALLWS